MARKSKIKVPKRVAGVKIPKVVRKGPVLQFVNSTAGRMLLAEALTAAVGLFAYQKGGDIKQSAYDAEHDLKRNTERLTHAFGEGVRAFREALADPDDVAAIEGEATERTGDTIAKSKKNSRRSAPEATAPF
jgi:hypothetical protein